MLLALCLILAAAPAWALWVTNGVLVCGEQYNQTGQRIISDGSQGATMVWMDYRSGTSWDIYGNRVDRDGNIRPGGVPICTADGDQTAPQFISDGTGGGIVTWQDFRFGEWDIYAQRVDGTGIAHWADNGIPICAEDGDQTMPSIVPDGAGGAIIIWEDYREGNYDIYAQRVTADGDTLWAADGMPVDTSMGDQANLSVVPDGSGGAIMVWEDTRNGDWEIYGQRIDNNGNLLWGPGAVLIRGMLGYPYAPTLAALSGGGACVTWYDYRNGWADVYAQKIGSDGSMLWQTDGVLVCPYSSYKYSPQVADDGSGGAIIAWIDERDSENYPVYAQRLDADGALAWQQNGVMVFPVYGNDIPRLVADGSGGIIAALDVYDTSTWVTDIWAQRLDHNGNVLWGPKGTAVCLAADLQYGQDLASDGRGGVIIVWEDYRAQDGYSDTYCQRVGPAGLPGSPEPVIISCLDVPQDQGGWVRIKTRASTLDAASETTTPILGYNVWRLIGGPGPGPNAASSSAVKTPAIDHSRLVALLSDPTTAKGVRVSKSQAVTLGLPPGEWEAVGFWLATRDTIYNAAVPTKNDSTEAGVPWETYIVTAHTTTAGMFVASAPDTGYSVDNLAPGVTAGFAGAEMASPHGLSLTWTQNGAPDMGRYNVYRGTDASFAPDESNRIGTTSEPTLFDGAWVFSYHYFYKLIAVDRHGNMGPPALLRPEDVKVGTLLTGFAAALKQSAIEVSWKLSEVDESASFLVLRSSGDGEFAELPSVEVAREALAFSVVDRSVEPGTTYRYRVSMVEGAETRTLFETDPISTPALPLTLYQNYPNPFNPSTTISYYMPVAAEVTLEVYDSSGRLLSRLVDGAREDKGTHSVEWRGFDARGSSVSSGVYFYRLRTGKEILSHKMILLR
jgi:hypothetical protein